MGTQSFLNSSRRYVLAGAIAALTLTSGVNGQAQDKPAGPAAPQPPATQSQPAMPRIIVTAGRSTVLTTDFDVSRIALTNPAMADATVVAPREILIDGKAAGTISLIVWGGIAPHPVRPGRRAAGRGAAAATAGAVPWRKHRGQHQRGCDRAVGTRLEHERDAARRARSPRPPAPSATSSTCCRFLVEARASRCSCRFALPKSIGARSRSSAYHFHSGNGLWATGADHHGAVRGAEIIDMKARKSTARSPNRRVS